MPTSPNSLTMTASLRPPASDHVADSVVLPAPRKPVMIVQGVFKRLIRLSPSIDRFAAERGRGRLCGSKAGALSRDNAIGRGRVKLRRGGDLGNVVSA